MEGNYHSSAGRYSRAITVYQKALVYPYAAPYAQAGLGLVYYNLDEFKAALMRFEESKKLLENLMPGEHRELRYWNDYNSGVVLFAQGDFPAAANSFRLALKTDSGRIEAKRNLELSLLSAAQSEKTRVENIHTPEGFIGSELIFDYLRGKEQNHWKSNEWTNEDYYIGPDY
jgi:tetratricopeptide (TPR) repeat protein